MALTDNLISYWRLEEASGTRNDSHSTNHLTDNNTVAQSAGKVGNCANFELDNGEYLSVASNASLRMGDISCTFAVWVNLESKPAGTMDFISKDNSTAGEREWLLGWTQTTDQFRLVAFDAATSTNQTTRLSSQAVSLATWYFVVGWHDADLNTLNIQVNNGAVDTTTGYTAGVGNSTASVRLGARFSAGSPASFFDGLMDEAAIWKRVLTTEERTWLYNSGSGRTYTEVLAGMPAGGGPLIQRRRRR